MKKGTSWTAVFKNLGSIQIALLLLAALSVFFCYEMGNRDFADPDEGRYVEVPREMVVSGDYVTPHLNGLKYFEKPVLFYWLQAAAIHVFGINEISMRLWIVIFAILGCLSLFGVMTARYSPSMGLVAAGILATNLLYYAHSQLIILDLVLSIFMSGSLWCFYLAFVKPSKKLIQQDAPPKAPGGLIVAMYALSALACLTKGLIGAVLPGMIAFLWIMATKNWRMLKQLFHMPGLLVFLAIFLPWHLLAMHRNSDFFDFYFIFEHFTRYTTKIHNRYQPWWFFLPIALVGMIPWSGFSLVAIKNSFGKVMAGVGSWKTRDGNQQNNAADSTDDDTSANNSHDVRGHTFFLIWIFAILVFFSLSNSKLIPYIVPIIPPIAFLTTLLLEDANHITSLRNFKWGSLLNIFLFVIIGAVFLLEKQRIADILQNENAQILIAMTFVTMAAMAGVMISAMFRRITIRHAVWLHALLAANMMSLMHKGAVIYQEVKKPSTKQFAQLINWNKKKGDLVFCYKKYYQDFPVYLQSRVGVVDYVGELQFGMDAAKKDGTLDPYHMMGEDEFWKLWHSGSKRIFLLLARSAYGKLFASKSSMHKIIHFDKNFVLITNK
jgi:4-amino-4-deoxy-L-arabinose transferase-like glycosyltransferase